MRIERRNVVALQSAKLVYELNPGQYFCEMPKAWEIWDESGLVKRIPRHRIFWVSEA